MSNTRVPSVLWNADQTEILIDTEKRQARKNIGLVSTGSANLPVYFDANGDAKPMNSIDDLPPVKTVNGSKWAGWSAESSTTHYGVDLEIGGGQVNRGVWSKIPSSDNTSAVDDTWMIVKGTDRNSIFLNRAPGSLNDNKGGYAFGRLTTPNWNDIRTAGLYGIYASSTPGTNGSPDSGRVVLLAGDAYSVNSTTGLPGSNDNDHYNTQLAMGGDIFYRTKVGSASWENWRNVVTQYKDTVTSAIYGYKLATTTVSNTLGDRTHYTALINVTPLKYAGNTNQPYLAYLDIHQVKESDKDSCQITLKMLSTPNASDYGTLTGLFVITGSNNGSDNGNYKHDWYIRRRYQNDTINDFSITVTPLLCEGSVLFKGLERATSPVTSSYIEYGRATPAISSLIYAYSQDAPVYIDSSGTLHPCDTTALRKTTNGSAIGSASTPVYINDNGEPTPCTIDVGAGSLVVPMTTINNHIYTAINITNGTSYNAGGTGTGQTGYTVFDESFPREYIPHDSPRTWPAGIMIFVNASIWIDNTDTDIQQASRVVFALYQDSTMLAAHNLEILTTQNGHLPVSFSAITADPIAYNTSFKLKVIGYDALQENVRVVKVWSVSYTISALI